MKQEQERTTQTKKYYCFSLQNLVTFYHKFFDIFVQNNCDQKVTKFSSEKNLSVRSCCLIRVFFFYKNLISVPYKHLTLPTKRVGEIPGGPVTLKKKKTQNTIITTLNHLPTHTR